MSIENVYIEDDNLVIVDYYSKEAEKYKIPNNFGDIKVCQYNRDFIVIETKDKFVVLDKDCFPYSELLIEDKEFVAVNDSIIELKISIRKLFLR